jgi:hypothetical protein
MAQQWIVLTQMLKKYWMLPTHFSAVASVLFEGAEKKNLTGNDQPSKISNRTKEATEFRSAE